MAASINSVHVLIETDCPIVPLILNHLTILLTESAQYVIDCMSVASDPGPMSMDLRNNTVSTRRHFKRSHSESRDGTS